MSGLDTKNIHRLSEGMKQIRKIAYDNSDVIQNLQRMLNAQEQKIRQLEGRLQAFEMLNRGSGPTSI